MELNKTLNPISPQERVKINQNWDNISFSLSKLQLQINLLAGGTDLEAVVDRIQTVTNNAESTTTDTRQALQDLSAALLELQMALDNSNMLNQEVRESIQELNNLINNFDFRGQYDNSANYQKGNYVRLNKDSYVALKNNTGILPTDDNVNWSLVAVGGLDGNVQELTNDLNQREINAKNPPEGLTPALGNGVADDSASLQAMIDYISNSGGGTLFLPRGNYIIGSTLFYKPKVSLRGEKGRFSSILSWGGNSPGYILNTVNVDLNMLALESLSLTSRSSKIGSGIISGSTFANYNAFNFRIKDVLLHDLNIGVYGLAISEAQDDKAIGLFDSYLENVWCSSCTTGLWLGGSATTIVNPRLSACGTGMVLDYASPESSAGVHVFGGIFAGNTSYDISIPDVRGIRSTSFNGTWFEDATNGIINIPNPDTFVRSLTFNSCQLNSKSTQFGLMNFFNANGAIGVNDCVITESSAGQDLSIISPSNLNGTALKVSNTIISRLNNNREILNYTKYNPWITLDLQNGWNQLGTRYFRTQDNILNLQIAMSNGSVGDGIVVANLPQGYRPSSSTRFTIFDATGKKNVNMYVTATGDLVMTETTNAPLTTGVWSGYISFKVD